MDLLLDAATIAAVIEQVAPDRAGRRRLPKVVSEQPGLLTGQGHHAPVPAVLRLIDMQVLSALVE